MEYHELANIFPMMSESEIQELGNDIKQNGQQESIIVYQEKILDGRNRFQACQVAEVLPIYEEYKGDDPLSFVISLNLKRRHLSESQKAMVAQSIANLEVGKKTANLQSSVTIDAAAAMMNVSPRSTATARQVAKEGEPELKQAVESGKVSVSAAKNLLALSPEEQKYVASLSESEIRQEVKKIRGTQGTGQNEWYTPKEYIEAAKEVLDVIDLDPASSEIANITVKAKKFYSIDDDGLSRDWQGRVWLNPPYSQPQIGQFIEKLIEEIKSQNVPEAILLTHNYTDTKWFHAAQSRCAAICFTKGRIGFLSPEGQKAAPTQGQAIFYFGNDVHKFSKRFESFGFVMVPHVI
jgi:phage N-6-adenine-methyltransferase